LKRLIVVLPFLLAFMLMINEFGAKAATAPIITWVGKDYNSVGDFKEGLAVAQKGKKYGYIDKQGKVVVDFIYDGAWGFGDGLARVKKYVNNGYGTHYGYINSKGEEVIPLQNFQDFGDGTFSEGLAFNGSDGYIDKTGKKVFSTTDGVIGFPFSEGLALGFKGIGGPYGFVDKQGQVAIPYQYEVAAPFKDGLAVAKKNGKWGYIDKTGKTVLPFKYEGASDFSDGVAAVETTVGNCFAIDKSGKELFEVGCETVLSGGYWPPSFSEGLIRSGREYYDKAGNLIFENKNGRGAEFKEGLAFFSGDKGQGFMNQKGEIVIEPSKEFGYKVSNTPVDFSDGVAVIKSSSRGYGIIVNPLAEAKRLEEEAKIKAEAEAKAKAEAEANAKAEAEAKAKAEAEAKANTGQQNKQTDDKLIAANVSTNGESKSLGVFPILLVIIIIIGIVIFFLIKRKKKLS